MDDDEFNFPDQPEDHVGFLDEAGNTPFEPRSFRDVLSTPIHALPRTVLPKADGTVNSNSIARLPALMKNVSYDVKQEHHPAPAVGNIVPLGMPHRWKPLRKATIRWSEDETEKFYKVVERFGTDLSLISLLFPGKERSEIKKKLKFERKSNPERVFEAMNCVNCDNDMDMAELEKGVDEWEAYRSRAVVPLTQDEILMLSDFQMGTVDSEQGTTVQSEQGTTVQSEHGTTLQSETVLTNKLKDESKTLTNSLSSQSMSKEKEVKNDDFNFEDVDDFNEVDDIPIAIQFGISTEPCEETKNNKIHPKKTKLKPAKEEKRECKRMREEPQEQTHESSKPNDEDYFDF